MSNPQPHVLIVGAEPKFLQELESAMGALAAPRPVVHQVDDYRRAVEAARTRHPELALVQMGVDWQELKTLAREMQAAAPGTAIVGVYRQGAVDSEIGESAALIESIRAGVQDFIRRPVSSKDLEQLFERIATRPSAQSPSLGKIVAFVSNKGGVGKSTLAINTATGLAKRHPDRVLLIDSSFQMGVCASMLDLQATTTMADALREQERLDTTLLRQLTVVHPSGLHLLAAPNDAVVAAEIDDALMTQVLTLARRAYDYVIVDTFPLFDRIVMAVLDLCDRCYIVLENTVPTVLSGVKYVELLDGLGVEAERQRVILNRNLSGAGNPTAADVARRLNRPVTHVLPYSRKVVAAANLGEPYVMRGQTWWGFGRAMRRLIDDVEAIRTTGNEPVVAKAVANDVEEPAS
ncbi:MAG: AAA family ATPase [Planctomycetaceae bacterium]|nr:AAA family ATPase [Planctomycetaceae bacterium]